MRKLFCITIITCCLASCSPSETVLVDKVQTIPKEGWKIEEPVRFEMEVTDTLQYCDVYITVRHNTDYEWMNLFLFLKTYYPNQEFSRDTLECFLADEAGYWFGKGSTSIKNCDMLFKRNVKFNQLGHYVFEFTQGMRTNNLNNIMDVGIRIVETPNQTP